MADTTENRRNHRQGGVSSHASHDAQPASLSLADIERRRSHPVQWAVFVVLILLAIILPYWVGRTLAVHQTQAVIALMGVFTPRGIALVAWTVTVIAFTGFALSFVESHSWLWRFILLLGVCLEQFTAGICLLKFDFWYSTRVVYGDAAYLADSANLGIIAAGLAAAVFAVVFVGLLVAIRKDSPLNVLTKGWVSYIVFFVMEILAMVVVQFGGLLTTF